MSANILTLLVPLLFTFLLPAQSSLPEGLEGEIDQLFAHVSKETPGYMVGVIENGTFLFQKGYGQANLEYQIPIDANSAFNVASLSKQFTAACVALLMLEGKVKMEDRLGNYFPDFPDFVHDIEIRHLIYMTSGINDYYYNPRVNNTDWSSLNFFNIDTAIAASLASIELMYPPGSRWSYSNINYMLLTKVVEKVSGVRFAEFARTKLFEPLGMNATYVNDDIFQVIPNRVNGYNFRDEENTSGLMEGGYLAHKGEGFLQINRNSPHYGGSGIYTTMNDLQKWVDNFRTMSFGGQAFYDLMHSTMAFDHDKKNDAFGLVHGDFNGHEIIWYEGGDWGFSSYMMRFPDSELTIICLSNLGSGNARKHAHQVVDVLVGGGAIELGQKR